KVEAMPKSAWTEKDQIDNFLKERRLMRSLKRFYTLAGNLVKEILLKLNLPDHRSILTDSKVTPTIPGRMTKPYSSPRFIANYLNAGYVKMVVKMLASMLSPSDSICSGGGGTDGGSDSEGGLDLLRDEDGNSNKVVDAR
ncbi:hypothetical protein Tco_0853115, partial [Tanacetum coccineum]